jgi:hypothetical protein
VTTTTDGRGEHRPGPRPPTPPELPAGQIVGWFEPGSPEAWHAARANGIGGSEISAVLGLSPHESRFSLWHRKQGLHRPVQETPKCTGARSTSPPSAPSSPIRTPAPPSPAHLRRRRRPWQIANPDRLVPSPPTAKSTSSKPRRPTTTSAGATKAPTRSPSTTGRRCRWYCRRPSAPAAASPSSSPAPTTANTSSNPTTPTPPHARRGRPGVHGPSAAGQRPPIDGHTATLPGHQGAPRLHGRHRRRDRDRPP